MSLGDYMEFREFTAALKTAAVLLPLAACANPPDQCTPWRPFKYSGSLDSPESVEAMRIHNQTGINLKCWDKEGK